MPGTKRPRPMTARRFASVTRALTSRPRTIKRTYMRKKMRKSVRRIVNAMAETKVEMRQVANNVGVKHNFITNYTTNLLYTDNGTRGEMVNDTATTSTVGIRNGRKLFGKGLAFRIKLENFQAQPHLVYKLMIVRHKYDNSITATDANLWEGAHTDKMLDYIDTESWEIKWSKTYTLKMPGYGSGAATSTTGQIAGTAQVDQGDGQAHIGRPKRFIKEYIPINRDVFYHKVQGAAAPEDHTYPLNMRWQLVGFCYSAYTAGTNGDDLGFIDCSTKFYTKDL